MSDITITLGADSSDLEKKVNAVGKTVGNQLGSAMKGGGGAAGGGGGGGGGAGGMGGAGEIVGLSPLGKLVMFMAMFGEAIFKAISAIKEFAEQTRELRNLSLATNMPIAQLQGLQYMAESMGLSLSTLAHGFGEFNKKMGEVRIKGGELANLLVKMHVPMDKIADGSLTATEGMKLLANAYASGTDAQTLAYYGNLMFGSSFEQMLPAIKSGAVNIDKYTQSVYEQTQASSMAESQLADDLGSIWQTVKNLGHELLGTIAAIMYGLMNIINIIWLKVSSMWNNPTESAGQVIDMMPKGLTPDQQREFAKKMGTSVLGLEGDKLDEFMKAIEERISGDGEKLNPLGLQSAQGASQLQQMAGGDIVSALAFSPLERIANATEETAQNTAPKNNPNEPQGAGSYQGEPQVGDAVQLYGFPTL
jgi:hypothetical protein